MFRVFTKYVFPLVQSFICLTPRTVGQSLGLHQAGYITPLSVALLGLSRSFNRNLPKNFPFFGVVLDFGIFRPAEICLKILLLRT